MKRYLVNGAKQATNLTSEGCNYTMQFLDVDSMLDSESAKVGDKFYIVGVLSFVETAVPKKTFEIIEIDGDRWTIAPAIIPYVGGSEYQKSLANVIDGPADNAIITIIED